MVKRKRIWRSDEQRLADFERVRERDHKAMEECRVIYVRGIPPRWTNSDLAEFFKYQGAVASARLLPVRGELDVRAGYVEFESTADAEGAMMVCNRLTLDEPGGGDFVLRCSIRSPKEKIIEEKRSVYIAGLPPRYSEDDVFVLVETYGRVHDINLLPMGWSGTLCCFVTMATREDAACAIEGLNASPVDGCPVEARLPLPPSGRPQKSMPRAGDSIAGSGTTVPSQPQVALPEVIRGSIANRVAPRAVPLSGKGGACAAWNSTGGGRPQVIPPPGVHGMRTGSSQKGGKQPRASPRSEIACLGTPDPLAAWAVKRAAEAAVQFSHLRPQRSVG